MKVLLPGCKKAPVQGDQNASNPVLAKVAFSGRVTQLGLTKTSARILTEQLHQDLVGRSIHFSVLVALRLE